MRNISAILSETGLSREGVLPVQKFCLDVEERCKNNSCDKHEPVQLRAILQSELLSCEDAFDLFKVIYTLEIFLNAFCQGRSFKESNLIDCIQLEIDSRVSETPVAHNVDPIYFDYVATLDIIYSWAVFCINVATVREETRIKSFSISEGEQLRIDKDSVIIGDIAVCSLLRSVQICLACYYDNVVVIENMRNSDHDGCGGKDDSDDVLRRTTSSGTADYAAHPIRESDCDHSTSTISENLGIMEISTADTGNVNKKKSMRNFKTKFESSEGHDMAKLRRTLQSLLSFCMVVRGSGEMIRMSVEELLSDSEHETLISIRLATAHTQTFKQDAATIPISTSISPSFFMSDIVSDLKLEIGSGKIDSQEKKKARSEDENENDFKFIAISSQAQKVAGQIIEFIEYRISQCSQKNILRNEKKTKNDLRDISVGKEPTAVSDVLPKSCYENEEIVTMTVISLCRLWSTWREGEWNDRLSVHGLLSFFNHMESKLKLELKTSTVFLSSAAVTACTPLGLQMLDRYQQKDKLLGMLLLLHVVRKSPGAMVASMSSWLLPLLLQKIKTVTYSPGAIVLTNRLVQSVIIPSMASSTGFYYSHLYLEGVAKEILVSCDPSKAMSVLLAVRPFVRNVPRAVLCCQLSRLIDGLLAMINRWHVPSQILSFLLIEDCFILCPQVCCDSHGKVAVELLRASSFLDSGVGDLSGGSEKNKLTDREILRNILCRVEKLLRKVNNNLFDEIFEIYGEVNQ